MIYLWWYFIKSLLNDEKTNEVFDWILDDCQNNYEMSIELLMNVETMTKMLMF